MEQYELDELDEKILSMMVKDARKPFLEVARECNVSGAAIHQRIQKLIHAGVVKGSEFIIDNSKIGFKTCAYMGLFLQSSDQLCMSLHSVLLQLLHLLVVQLLDLPI